MSRPQSRACSRWIDSNGNYTRVPNIVIDDVELSAPARHTYSLLVRSSFWKKLNGTAIETLVSWIGTDALAEAMDCTVRSLTRHMRELQEKGLIDRTRRMGKNSQTIVFNPKTVYGEASQCEKNRHEDTSDVTSGHQWRDVRTPVARRQDTSGLTEVEETGTKSEPDKDLQDRAESNQDVIEQDVTEQDVPEQEPRDDGAAANDTGSPGETPTTAGLDSKSTTEKVETNATAEKVETNATVEETSSCASPSSPRARGVFRRRAESAGISKGAASKIGAPKDDLGVDERDPETARQVWDEFQRAVTETNPGYNPPGGATGRELSNCSKLLFEYAPGDILKMIDMVVSRWAVVREKWPKVAKTPVPSFYVLFTLRRELMPLAQSGKGLTSRTHRMDPGAEKPPKLGWGDL